MVEWLERLFPGLRRTAYRVTSPATDVYNCIAWATGDTADWWWPTEHGRRTHWPGGVSREETLEALRAVFGTIAYVECTEEALEPGFERVALFVDTRGMPTHAARQLPSGQWTSKLGQAEDIEHELHALEGHLYGTVALLMKRPMPR